ncbi:MAG: hypothetical protein JST49_06610 [Bacteroidetes bacterium]|nr:hypothetical protein [Bacteroidota bacterium]
MKTSLNALHHQGNDWLRELEFYKDELALLTTRLEEVASKNTDKDVLAQVEHFQNKFVLLRQQIDELKHDVNKRNSDVTELSKDKPTHVTENYVNANSKLQNGMLGLVQSIATTRFEFNEFLSKTL